MSSKAPSRPRGQPIKRTTSRLPSHFQSFLLRNYLSAFVPGRAVNQLYVDGSIVLQPLLQKAQSVAELHQLLYESLDQLLTATTPTKSVMVALDGPAPVPKLLALRKRRRKEFTKGPEYSFEFVEKTPSLLWLAPGTPVVQQIEDVLTTCVGQLLSQTRYQSLTFEMSGASVVGEAATKLFSRLLNPLGPQAPEGETKLVVGNAPDLIPRALASRGKKVFICNPSDALAKSRHRYFSVAKIYFVPKTTSLPIPKDQKKEAGEAGDFTGKAAGEESEALRESKPEGEEEAGRQEQTKKDGGGLKRGGGQVKLLWAHTDLALVALLTKGNDYLPGMPNVTIEACWPLYMGLRASSPKWRTRSLAKRESSKVSLDLSFLTALLEPLSELEQQKKAMERREQPAEPSVAEQPSGQAKVEERRGEGESAAEGEAGEGPSGGEVDEEAEREGPQGNPLKGAADPERYLQGLVWVLQTYLDGHCSDSLFEYGLQAPTPTALLEYLKANPKQPPQPLTPRPPLSPAACMLASLPREAALRLAPPELRPLLQSNSAIADTFDSCEECEGHTRATKSTRRRQREALRALEKAQKKLRQVSKAAKGEAASQEGSGADAEAAAKQVELLEGEFFAAKEDARKTLDASKQHQRAVHPYKPYPSERVEAAVAEALQSEFWDIQKPTFGNAYLFRYVSPKEVKEKGLFAFSFPVPPHTSAALPATATSVVRQSLPADPLPQSVSSSGALPRGETSTGESVPGVSLEAQPAKRVQRNKPAGPSTQTSTSSTTASPLGGGSDSAPGGTQLQMTSTAQGVRARKEMVTSACFSSTRGISRRLIRTLPLRAVPLARPSSLSRVHCSGKMLSSLRLPAAAARPSFATFL